MLKAPFLQMQNSAKMKNSFKNIHIGKETRYDTWKQFEDSIYSIYVVTDGRYIYVYT